MERRIIKRYSEAFKRHVVQAYESGQQIGVLQAKYGIQGTSTVQRWVSKYGRQGLRSGVMRIQSPEEYDEVKRLKAELAQAQALNQELALEVFMLRATLGVAEAELGYAVKKKRPTPSLRKPASPKRRLRPTSP